MTQLHIIYEVEGKERNIGFRYKKMTKQIDCLSTSYIIWKWRREEGKEEKSAWEKWISQSTDSTWYYIWSWRAGKRNRWMRENEQANRLTQLHIIYEVEGEGKEK